MRFILTVLACTTLVALNSLNAAEPNKEQLAFFETKIRPVLVKHCYSCHAADSKEVKGGLLLDTREGLRRGGESGGHGVVPGEPEESTILEAMRYESFEMPPDQQLSESVIADFEKWIKMGAPDPRDGKSLVQKKIDFEAAKSYWAYQPITQPQPPKTTDWAKTDIDRFIEAKFQDAGIAPVADAAPTTLIRRVYFDLIGLPPTPHQVAEYTEQPTQDRLTEIVDRLLASPQFGERWGRHWLDVVRYGESTGMERNYTYPHAWRYRDYVIASFNADKPYDRFLTEQLAGDLLPAQSEAERKELLTATGMLAIGPKSLNERNREQFAMDIVDDQIDVATRAFLGLTVACARCHDHKFDAIPQSEYYAMAGIFRSTDTYYGTGGGRGNRQNGQILSLQNNEIKAVNPNGNGNNKKNNSKNLTAQLNKYQKQLVALKKRKSTNAIKKRIEQFEGLVAKLEKQIANQKKRAKDEPTDKPTAKPTFLVMGVQDANNVADTQLRLRGEPDDRGKTIPRGFLTVASRFETPHITQDSSGRLELARWMTDPKNPLTARVAANRFWQHLFGRGIVGTVNNFGNNGEKPTHPELLEYLASQFVENGWSVKSFVRSIVLSRTYQLSSHTHEKGLAADPDNELLWHQNQRRLEAEAIRDAMLLASGELDWDPMTASVVTRVGDGDIGRGINASQFATAGTKRSVYLPIVRSAVPETLQVFDFPEPSIIAGQRDVTTVPTQALFMLNSDFVLERAEHLAQRLLEDDTLATDADRIVQAFRHTLCREPSTKELTATEKFLAEALPMTTSSNRMPARLKAWMGICHVLLGSSEFRYLQ